MHGTHEIVKYTQCCSECAGGYDGYFRRSAAAAAAAAASSGVVSPHICLLMYSNLGLACALGKQFA